MPNFFHRCRYLSLPPVYNQVSSECYENGFAEEVIMRRDEYLINKNGFRKGGPAASKSIELNAVRYGTNLAGKVALTNESLSFFFSLLKPNTLRNIYTDLTAILPCSEEKKAHRYRGDVVHTLIEQITELPQECPPSRYKKYETAVIRAIGKGLQNDPQSGRYPKRLLLLADRFGLTDTEKEIVLFFLMLIQSETLSDLYDQFEGAKAVRFISIAVGKPEAKVTDALSQDGKLLQMRFLENTISHNRHGAQRNYELSDQIVNYIHGLDSESFRRAVFTEGGYRTFPLDRFVIKQEELSVINALIGSTNPVNILFYGKPGTGKTELAKAVCRSAGKTPYFLKANHTGETRRPPFHSGGSGRILLLQLALNVLKEKNEVLVVDEADEILNTRNSLSAMFGLPSGSEKDKGIINSIIDEHKKQIIWITNSVTGIEDSVLRRFSYSRNFIKTSVSQRKIYWNSLIKKYKTGHVLSREDVEELASGYQINAGHIGKALETFSSLPKEQADIGILKEVLDKQTELLGYGNRRKQSQASHNPMFDLRFIHTDIPVDRVLTALRGMYRGHILLHGVPGTGKTEFARYIAAELDKELLLKRSSDILSKWVGENEQNIRDAFAEAEADGAVLCIDEADSFFKNRESARASWEVSFTNELLTQMESFSGIFVCSTNLINILDPAVMRRFAWKVEFLPLKKEHRAEIVQAYFQFLDVAQKDRSTFADITDLTPGDVKAVWLKYGTSPSLSPAEIAEELKRETGYRATGAGEIGFRG
jgi:transitional endoplasmic reticulum ATPase